MIAVPESILRQAPFVLYWSARTCAAMGFQMLGVAVAWQMYALTGSALDLGLVGLAQFVPMAAFMLVAGQIADRYDRRRVLQICQTVEWLVAAVLIAEIGIDMSQFLSVYHLAAWAGVCPGSSERAGKQIIVCVGALKTFGYPEFFAPGHVVPSLPENTRIGASEYGVLLSAACEFIERIVDRYKRSGRIVAWQMEHEAVDPLGMEHSWRLDAGSHVNAVRDHDVDSGLVEDPRGIVIGLFVHDAQLLLVPLVDMLRRRVGVRIIPQRSPRLQHSGIVCPELQWVGRRFHVIDRQRIEFAIRIAGRHKPYGMGMVVDRMDAIDLRKYRRVDWRPSAGVA